MLLYLVRHGEAKPKEEDPERGLTEQGVRTVQAVARFLAGALARQDLRIEAIWHSGKKRALQTAEILAEALGISGSVEARPSLDPNDPPLQLAWNLAGENRSLAVVGHLPFLGKLVSLLITGREDLDLADLPAGGVICLQRREQGWIIRWLLAPEFCQG